MPRGAYFWLGVEGHRDRGVAEAHHQHGQAPRQDEEVQEVQNLLQNRILLRVQNLISVPEYKFLTTMVHHGKAQTEYEEVPEVQNLLRNVAIRVLAWMLVPGTNFFFK